MDHTSQPRLLSFCSGYAGLDLGLERVIGNVQPVSYVEIEAFAAANLVAKMEAGCLAPAPIWTDLKTFPVEQFCGCVDIITAGYPCQPFSVAGKRSGAEDPRHLWPYIQRAVAVIRPGLCVFENVGGHVTSGLKDVLWDLGEMGYETACGLFTASEVGAPHRRQRVFIVAISDAVGRGRWSYNEGECSGFRDGVRAAGQWPSGPGEPQAAWEPPRTVANAQGAIRGRTGCPDDTGGWTAEVGGSDGTDGQDGKTLGAVRGGPDGPARGLAYAELCVSHDSRVDELRAGGNGVVPAQVELAIRTLLREFI